MAPAAEESRQVRRSFGLRTVVALLGLLATFLTSVVTVRALDTRAAAAFLAVLAALMLGPMVGRLGLGQNCIRAVASASSPEEESIQVVAHLRAVTLLSLLSSPVVAWLATAGLGEDRGQVLLLVAGLIVLEAVRLTVSDIHAALGRITWSVAATHHSRSIAALCALAVVLALHHGRTSLTLMLISYATVSLVLLIVVAVPLPRRRHRTERWWAPMLVAVGAGAQLFALEIGAFLVGRADVWLAGWAFPSDQALLYSTASVLAMQVTVLEGLANIAITPVAARLWQQGRRERVLELLSASATVSTAVTMLLVGGVWLFGAQALSIYGSDLQEAAVYLSVLATGGLGMSLFGSCAVLLVIAGRGRAAAAAVGVALTVVAPAAFLAATLGGPLALAIVSGSATALLFASYAVACRRTFGTAPLPDCHVLRSLLVLAGRDGADRPEHPGANDATEDEAGTPIAAGATVAARRAAS